MPNTINSDVSICFVIFFLGSPGKSDIDGLPYSTLGYANGLGYKPPQSDGTRYDTSGDDTGKYIYIYIYIAIV